MESKMMNHYAVQLVFQDLLIIMDKIASKIVNRIVMYID